MTRAAYQNVPWLIVMLMLTAIRLIGRIVQEVAVELNQRIAPFEYEVYVSAELFVVGVVARVCLMLLLLLLSRIRVAKTT